MNATVVMNRIDYKKIGTWRLLDQKQRMLNVNKMHEMTNFIRIKIGYNNTAKTVCACAGTKKMTRDLNAKL
jgi:hypothetical protein